MTEHRISLLYLLAATLILTGIGGWVLVRTCGYPAVSARSLADRINREQQLFDQQRQYVALLDSLHHDISAYHSDVTAVYIESDIEEQIADIRNLYTSNGSRPLYRVFDQAANFYLMMYRDKQILTSKKSNIALFAKRLDDCRLGYHAAPVVAPVSPPHAPTARP